MGRKKWNIFLALLMILSLFPVRSYITQAETAVGTNPKLSKEAKRVEGSLNQWEVDLKVEVEPEQEDVDIVFVLDVSSSMRYKNRIGLAKEASTNFAKELKNDKIRLALVTFGSDAKVVHGFTSDRQKFINEINDIIIEYRGKDDHNTYDHAEKVDNEQYTFTTGGLQKAEDLLKKSTAKHKKIVFVSDGAPNAVHKLKKEVADKLFTENVTKTITNTRSTKSYNYRSDYVVLQDPSVIFDLDPSTAFSEDSTSAESPVGFVISHWIDYPEDVPTNYGRAATLFDQESIKNKDNEYWHKKTIGKVTYDRYRKWTKALPSTEVTMLYIDKVKHSLPETEFYAVDMNSGAEGKRVLQHMGSNEENYFYIEDEGDKDGLKDVLQIIADRISISIDDAEIIDPMGEGFKLIGEPKVIMGDDEKLEYNPDEIKWQIPKNGFTYDKESKKYVAHIRYIVEADDETISKLESGEESLQTNGDAKLTYKKDGKPKEKEFPKPEATPSVLKVTKELYDEEGNLISLEDDKHQRKYHYHLDVGEDKNQTFETYLTHGEEERYHLYQTTDEVNLYETEIEYDDLDRFEVRYFFETENGEYEELEVDEKGRAIFQLKPESGINHFIIRNYPKKDYKYTEYTVNKKVVDENNNQKAELGETLTYTIDIENEKDAFIREVVIQDDLKDIVDYLQDHNDNPVSVMRNGEKVDSDWTVGELKEGIITHLDKKETLSLSFDVQVTEDQGKLSDGLMLKNTVYVNDKESTDDIKVVLPKYELSKSVQGEVKDKLVEAGERLDYTITVTNTGDVRIPELKVQDKMEDIIDHLQEDQLSKAEVKYQDKSVPLMELKDEGLVLEDIQPEEKIDLKFSVYLKESFDADQFPELTNTATAGNKEAKATIKTGKPRINVKKEAFVGNEENLAVPGETISYKIVVSNEGNVIKEDVKIQDDFSRLKDHVEDFSDKTFTLTSDKNTELKEEKDLSELIDGFTMPIDKDESITIEYDLVVKKDLDITEVDKLINTVTADDKKSSVETETGKPLIKADKKVVIKGKEAIDGEEVYAEAGDTLVYTIKAWNAGEVTKENVVVKDDLNELKEYLDTDFKSPVFLAGKTHTLDELKEGIKVDLAPSQQISINFEVKLKDDLDLEQLTTLKNIAKVDDEEHSAEVQFGKPDIQAEKKVYDANNDGYAEPGETLKYVIEVKNDGYAGKEVFIKDDLKAIEDNFVLEDSEKMAVEDVFESLDNIDVKLTKTSKSGAKEDSTKELSELREGFNVYLDAKESLNIEFKLSLKEDLDIKKVPKVINKAEIDGTIKEAEVDTGEPKLTMSKHVHDHKLDENGEIIEEGNMHAEPNELLHYKIIIHNSGKVADKNLKILDDLNDFKEYLDLDLEDQEAVKIYSRQKSKEDKIEEANENVKKQQEARGKLIATASMNDLMTNGIFVDIDSGETLEVHFSVKVKETFTPELGEDFKNTVKVGPLEDDVSIPQGKPEIYGYKEVIELDEELRDGFVENGEKLAYRIIVRNEGNIKAEDVVIRDRLEEINDYIEEDTSQVDVQVTKNPIDPEKEKENDMQSVSETISHEYKLDKLMSDEGIKLDIDALEEVIFEFEITLSGFDVAPKENKIFHNRADIEGIEPEEHPEAKIPAGKAKIVSEKSLDKEFDGKVIEPGETLTYHIEVKNIGHVKKRGLLVKDTLKDIEEYLEFSKDDKVTVTSSFENNHENTTFTIGQLQEGIEVDVQSGETLKFSFEVKVKNLDVDKVESLKNTVVVGKTPDPENPNEDSPQYPSVEFPTGKSDITVKKTVEDENNDGYAEAGEELTYTITVTNTGKAEARNVKVKDDLSSLEAHIEAIDDIILEGDVEDKALTDLVEGFEINVPAKSEVKISFTVCVKEDFNADDHSELANTALVGEKPKEGEPWEPEKPSIAIPTGKPEIKAIKSVKDQNGDGYAEAGEELTYEIKIHNYGEVTKKDLWVKDDLASLEGYIDSIENVKYEVLSNESKANSGEGFVQVSEGDLKTLVDDGIKLDVRPLETLIVRFTVKVNDVLDVEKTKTLSNTAIVDGEEKDTSIDTGQAVIGSTKRVVESIPDGFVEPGETLTYQIEVWNDGEVTKRNLRVKDTLDKIKDYLELPNSVSVKSSKKDTEDMTFEMEDLMNEGILVDVQPDEKLQFSFDVKFKDDVDLEKVKHLNNTAIIGETPDPDKPGSDLPQKPSVEIPTAEAKITASKLVQDQNGDGYAEAGEALTYTIIIKNNGEVDARDVTVKDDLSAIIDHIDPIDDIILEGDVEDKTLTDLVEGFEIDVPAESEVNISFTVRVKDNFEADDHSELVNTALVGEKPKGDKPWEPENPSIPIPTGKPEITATKSVKDQNGDGYAEAGEALTYTITVKNDGKVAARDVTVKDDLSAIIDHIDPIDDIILEGDVEDKTLTDLVEGFEIDVPAESEVNISFTVRVKDNFEADDHSELVNTALVGEKPKGDKPWEPENPSIPIPTGKPEITATKSVKDQNDNGYAEAGERLDYVITVQNTGEVAKKDLLIQDPLSEMKDYLEDTSTVKVAVGEDSISLKELQEGIRVDLGADEEIKITFSVYLREDLPTDQLKVIENTVYVDDVPETAEIPVGAPKISIQKSVEDENKDGYVEANEKLYYTIKVSNTGEVEKKVFIQDDLKDLKGHVKTSPFSTVLVNGERMPLRKLIRGFEYNLGANEIVMIHFELEAQDTIETDELYNIAYADEAFADVSIPVQKPVTPIKPDEKPKEPASIDPLPPLVSGPTAPLPATGQGDEMLYISLVFLMLGFVLAWRDNHED